MNVGKQHGVLKNAGSLEMPLVYGNGPIDSSQLV